MPLISLLCTRSVHRQRSHWAPSDDGEAGLDLGSTRGHRFCFESGCPVLVIRQPGRNPVHRKAHLLARSGPRPLRGASMVHVPADSEYGSWVCTKPPKSIRSAAGDFPERHCMGYTPIEIAREQLDSSEVRPYNGCTRGGADPWTNTGDSLSTCEGWPGKKAAAPTATPGGTEDRE